MKVEGKSFQLDIFEPIPVLGVDQNGKGIGIKMDGLEIKKVMDTKQYIVVKLGNEQYGIDIQYIDNIVRMQRITRVPKAQPYFKGVINIRGEIIPVMSLRLKFELEADQIANKTRILIIKLEPQSAVGIIVDEVKEVITLADGDIDKITANSVDERTAYLSGIGKHGNNLVSLLNIASVIIDKEPINN